jgi:hypothetical protein
VLSVRKGDFVFRESFDPGENGNLAFLDESNRADIDERDARPASNLGDRPSRFLLQSVGSQIANGRPKDRGIESIRPSRRQNAFHDGNRDNGNPQQFERKHVDGTTDREAGLRPVLPQINGDLAARVAEADHEDLLVSEGFAGSVLRAVQENASKA